MSSKNPKKKRSIEEKRDIMHIVLIGGGALIGLIVVFDFLFFRLDSNASEAYLICCSYWCFTPLVVMFLLDSYDSHLGYDPVELEHTPDSSNRDVCQRWFCDNAPYGDCPTCGVKYCSNHAKHSFDSPWPIAKFGNRLPNKIWPCRFCYDRQKKERFPNSSRAQFDEYLLNTLGKRNITKHRSVSTKIQSKSNLTPSSNVPESKAPSVIGKAARVILLPIVIIGGIFWLGSSDHKKGGPP